MEENRRASREENGEDLRGENREETREEHREAHWGVNRDENQDKLWRFYAVQKDLQR
jgi:hypothetical protein